VAEGKDGRREGVGWKRYGHGGNLLLEP
jgi:hypothetical protein